MIGRCQGLLKAEVAEIFRILTIYISGDGQFDFICNANLINMTCQINMNLVFHISEDGSEIL